MKPPRGGLQNDTRVSVLRADNSDEQKQNKNVSTQRLNDGAYGGERVSHGF